MIDLWSGIRFGGVRAQEKSNTGPPMRGRVEPILGGYEILILQSGSKKFPLLIECLGAPRQARPCAVGRLEMRENMTWADRRQFGRRPLDAPAMAELPGPVEVPCVIKNISEGGALLAFPTGIAPIERFDLVVENFPFRVPCEMRHQLGNRFGARFRRRGDGDALVKHFFPETTDSFPSGAIGSSKKRLKEKPTVSVRELRDAVLPLLVGETSNPRR